MTRQGIPTGFHFLKSNDGPYAPEVEEAISVLSDLNLIAEVQTEGTEEIKVSPRFRCNAQEYTGGELFIVDRAIDLLSRVKSTDQAEMMATVLFSFDSLSEGQNRPTEWDIFVYVMQWKPHWAGKRDAEVISTIKDLAEMGYMMPDCSSGFFDDEEELV